MEFKERDISECKDLDFDELKGLGVQFSCLKH